MAHTSEDGQVTLRWLDQKSTITSSSCRFDQAARAMCASQRSNIASQWNRPMRAVSWAGDMVSVGQRLQQGGHRGVGHLRRVQLLLEPASAPFLRTAASSSGVAPYVVRRTRCSTAVASRGLGHRRRGDPRRTQRPGAEQSGAGAEQAAARQ